jgi:hypothetical protein
MPHILKEKSTPNHFFLMRKIKTLVLKKLAKVLQSLIVSSNFISL